MSVEQQNQESAAGASPELRAVEAGLKALWEKARHTSDVLHGVRDDKRTLESRVEELEREVSRLTQELRRREDALRMMETTGGDGARRGAVIGDGEREALAQRIKGLLEKLDAYL